MSIVARAIGCVLVLSPASLGVDVVRRIDLTANDLIVDPSRSMLYASVPSSAGAPRGNSITEIDPVSASLGSSTFVGSEPSRLAIADNGQFIYAALDGAAAVRQYDVAARTAGLQFALGDGGFSGPHYVEDIEVMPGNPSTVAVSRRNLGFSPRHEGVAIYDNGVMRPQTTPDHTGSNVIEFGANAGTLYGQNTETTEFGFRTMAITGNGVTVTNVTQNLFSGFGGDFIFDGQYVIGAGGRVIEPVSRTIVGTFSLGGSSVVSDPANDRVLFLSSSGSSAVLRAYQRSTFLPLGTLTIPNLTGNASSLQRWGVDGLAFRTSNQIVIVNTELVPSPGSFAVGVIGGVVALRRRRPTPMV